MVLEYSNISLPDSAMNDKWGEGGGNHLGLVALKSIVKFYIFRKQSRALIILSEHTSFAYTLSPSCWFSDSVQQFGSFDKWPYYQY